MYFTICFLSNNPTIVRTVVMSLTCFVLWAHIITIVTMLTEMSFNMECDTHGHDTLWNHLIWACSAALCIAAKEEERARHIILASQRTFYG